MVHAVFYTHQSIGACAHVCMCDHTHQMKKTVDDDTEEGDKNLWVGCCKERKLLKVEWWMLLLLSKCV